MELVKTPNSILTTPTDRVIELPSDEIISQMRELMHKNGGIGLAANQAGLNLRFFIAYFEREFVVCINPMIVSHGREVIVSPEGCLSVVGADDKPIYKPRDRYAIIDVEYYTPAGFVENKITKKTLKRLNAKIFQHECDHLDGRLCHNP